MKATIGQVLNFRHLSESGLSVIRLTFPGDFPAGLPTGIVDESISSRRAVKTGQAEKSVV